MPFTPAFWTLILIFYNIYGCLFIGFQYFIRKTGIGQIKEPWVQITDFQRSAGFKFGTVSLHYYLIRNINKSALHRHQLANVIADPKTREIAEGAIKYLETCSCLIISRVRCP